LLSGAYLLTIWALWSYKRDQKPSEVNLYVAGHNLILVLMSFTMCAGTVIELARQIMVIASLEEK
jgi:hypothetical protein